MRLEQVLWVEKYRPKTVDDCILQADLKATFKNIVKDGFQENLLLSGPAGVGKTTVAKAICEELRADYITINGSMNGNIDTLRTEILSYASTVSLVSNSRKVVILDEADYLNPNSTQPALRNFMEEFSKNCGFILTCNFRNRIIDPLQSRCSTIEFGVPRDKDEKAVLVKESIKRLLFILEQEKVQYDTKAVVAVLKKFYPDMRKIINELQRYSKIGKIDSGILAEKSNLADLIGTLRDKDFKAMRVWVAENADLDFDLFVTELYKLASDILKPESIPQLILHLAEYQYRNAFVANKEVNLAALLTLVMADCTFK